MRKYTRQTRGLKYKLKKKAEVSMLEIKIKVEEEVTNCRQVIIL